MTHWTTPWKIGEDDVHGQSVIRGEHIEIATCWHHSVGAIEKEMRANAARIVACVNACDGIDNAALDAGVIAELVDVARAFATKDIPVRPNGSASHYAIPHNIIKMAQSALAKLGQTP